MKHLLLTLAIWLAASSAWGDLTTDLISYWKLDEASGNALDVHGSNELTDANTVGAATGKINGGRDFETGNNERFTHASNAGLQAGNSSWTFAGWIKFESLAARQAIVAKNDGSTAAGSEYYLLWYEVPSRMTVISYSGSTTVLVSDTTALSTGTWYFVVAWKDHGANTLNIQVNNNTPTSGSITGGNATATGFELGSANAAVYLDGVADEWGFWKRVLTPQERTDLYNSGSGLSYDDFDSGAPANTGNFFLLLGSQVHRPKHHAARTEHDWRKYLALAA